MCPSMLFRCSSGLLLCRLPGMPPPDMTLHPRTIRVALLHLGNPDGGIHRYGRMLADALRDLRSVEVSEHDADLTVDGAGAVTAAVRTANALASADVSIVPYGRYGLWAQSSVRLVQLAIVLARTRRRTVAVLHDGPDPDRADRLDDAAVR